MQQNIFYHSGNVANLTHTLVTNVAPNYTYSIASPFTLNHMRDISNPSGLVYSNIVHYSGNVSFTAPPDNVSASFELVRVGTSATDTYVTLYYSNFDYENYDNYNYSFYAKAYDNVERTTLYSSQKSNIVTKDSSGNLTWIVSNLTTSIRYFQINTFKNETVNCNVYTGPGTSSPSSLLSFNVYDVRGLAYMRDYRYDTGFVEIANISGYTNSTGQGMVLLSADGNRKVSIQEKTNGTVQITGYKWNMLLSKWDVFSTTSKNGFSKNHRYVYNSLISGSHISSFSSAFSPNGDFFVIGSGSTLSVVAFDASFTEKASIAFPITIHCVTMSADGKNILVSGNHVDDSSDLEYIGPSGGTAKIYSFDGTNLNEVADLSSYLIPEFANNVPMYLYYGSNSVISGDGKTVLVIGSMVQTNSRGFLWKLNNIDNKWVYVTRINISLGVRGYTPCSMSHDGKVFVVNDSPHERLASIFETSDYLTWNENKINIFEYLVCDCDISGDGKTVLFSLWKKFENKDFLLYYKVGSSWIQKMNHLFSERTKDDIYQHCSLSYDGSTMTMIDTTNLEISTLRIDKNVTINAVYDYFNRPYDEYYHGYASTNLDWNNKTLYDLANISHSTTKYKWYGYQDGAGISKDGNVVVVGSPMEKKVYVYTWNGTDNYTETSISNSFPNFGMTCSMDDNGKYCVVGATSNVCVYDLASVSNPKQTIDIGTGNTTWNLRISNDGSTVIWTTGVNVTTIQGRRRDNPDWSGTISNTTFNTSHSLEAIDLSFDGSIVVGTGNNNGKFSIFEWGISSPKTTRSQPIDWNTDGYSNYWGQAICIQGNTKKLAISVPHNISGGTMNIKARVFVYDISDPMNPVLQPTPRDINAYPTTNYARYGRSVSIAFTSFTDNQPVICVSGTQREYTSSSSGGAIVHFNGYSFTKYQSIPTEIIHDGGITSSGLRDNFNGFGIVTRMAGNGSAMVIAGGGYAHVYR